MDVSVMFNTAVEFTDVTGQHFQFSNFQIDEPILISYSLCAMKIKYETKSI
jgi:hypothetical protein